MLFAAETKRISEVDAELDKLRWQYCDKCPVYVVEKICDLKLEKAEIEKSLNEAYNQM